MRCLRPRALTTIKPTTTATLTTVRSAVTQERPESVALGSWWGAMVAGACMASALRTGRLVAAPGAAGAWSSGVSDQRTARSRMGTPTISLTVSDWRANQDLRRFTESKRRGGRFQHRTVAG